MALAIIRFLSVQGNLAGFRIDTGTNPYYYLKIGEGIAGNNGAEFVEGVSFKTGMQTNEKSESLFDTDKQITLPADLFSKQNCYVQLFSFKNTAGKSPAFSKVIKVPVALKLDPSPVDEYAFSHSIKRNDMSDRSLNSHRNIPYAEARSLQSAKLNKEDLLRAIIKVAGPIVLGLVSGCRNNHKRSHKNIMPQIGMFNTILETFLHGWRNEQPAYIGSISQSMSGPSRNNRFIAASAFIRPFEVTPGDANMGSMLPEFEEDKFFEELLAEIQKEALLKIFMDDQQASNNPGSSSEINIDQLMKLLQQDPSSSGSPQAKAPAAAAPVATAPAPPPTTPQVATTKSIVRKQYAASLSDRCILSFETGAKVMVNDKDQIVFNKNADIRLRIAFNIVGDAPKEPLPKAIFSFCFKDQSGKILFEKIFKQKDVNANSVTEFLFSVHELESVPAFVPVTVIAEMKWLTSKNTEVKTLGNMEMVLADQYLPKSKGKGVSEEKELTDMKVYRSFWNRIWESPVPDNMNGNDEGANKHRWALQVHLKYCVVLSGAVSSNGLMNTKILAAEKDEDGINEKTTGKMKAGIELSISELNKMSTLWGREPVADAAKLGALQNATSVTGMALDCIHPINIKGKAHERGMVWIVPALKLYDFYLNKVKTIDEFGQVTEAEEETIQLPLPESIRILGLKST